MAACVNNLACIMAVSFVTGVCHCDIMTAEATLCFPSRALYPLEHCLRSCSTTNSAPPRGSGCTLFANNPSSPAQRLFSFFRRRFRRIHGGKEGSNKFLAATPASKSSSSGQEEEGGGDATESVPIRGWDSRMGADAMESFLAACLGSALDVDHFLAAGSLRLSKARGLTQRSWGHSIAVLLLAVRPWSHCVSLHGYRFVFFPFMYVLYMISNHRSAHQFGEWRGASAYFERPSRPSSSCGLVAHASQTLGGIAVLPS